MQRRIPLVVLSVLVLFSGCTPLGENSARRMLPFGASGDRIHLIRRTGFFGPAVDSQTRDALDLYGPAVKESAARYGFDWRLVLAMMRQESGFESAAESNRGATGFMQIMPVTQREIAEKIELDDSTHPATNIRVGAYYLRALYDMFPGAAEADRLKLALAAYNAGLGRVRDAQDVAAYLGDSPLRWQAVRAALPLLSKRFASLHAHVWSEERPRSGWFGGARQTVAYVDSVMAHYEGYLRQLD